MKKLIGIVVALAIVLAMLPVAAFAANNYYVAGESALCGSNWTANDPNNKMTADGDVYKKTYSNVAIGNYQFKITDGTWGNSWGDNGGNYKFAVTTKGDITITFDPSTKAISVGGEGVGEAKMEIKYVTAVGAGKNGFLNNADWKPADASNKMTEADGVYTISYENVSAGTYEYKFAANGDWSDNWGYNGETPNGTVCDAVYNSGSNAKVVVAEDGSTVTLTLDLSAMDNKGNGAKITATVEAPKPEPVIETVVVTVGGMAMPSIPASSYVNLEVDATAGDVALVIYGSENTYLDNGMQIFYPDQYNTIERTLPAGSVYTLKLGTFSAEGEMAIVMAESMAPGTMANPAELVIGENVANIPASEGYYFTWTATEEGTLTISVDANSTDWTFGINGERADGTYYYGDTHFASDNDSSESVAVKPGDVFQVIVGTESWEAGSVTLNAAFVAGTTGGGEGDGEEGGDVGGDTDPDALVSVTDEPVKADEPWVYTFTAVTTGTLNIKNSEGVCYKIFGLEGPDSESLRYTSSQYSAGTEADYRVEVAGEITVKVWAYDYGEVDGNISVTLTFTPDEGEQEVQKEEYIVSDIMLGLGDNSLTLDENAITTIYEFRPEETGVYVFTVNNQTALVGYWGAGSFFVWDQTENKTNTLEQELNAVGQSIMVGVSGVEGEFTLTVEKKGDAEEIVNVEYEDYVNTHFPDSSNNLVLGEGEELVRVDISEAVTVVKGEDGFYHMGTADGPILYVDLDNEMATMTDAYYGSMGAITLRGQLRDADGNILKAYNFLGSLKAYIDAKDDEGMYPMTEDLVIFLKAYGGVNGWFMPGLSAFDAINADHNADSAWLVCSYYVPAEEEETPSDPVVTPEYFVTGEGDLFGNWAADNANGVMTESADGVYKFTLENVPAGNYKFKVTNGTWDECYGDPNSGDPDGNYLFTVEATSDVTITFNSADGTIEVAVSGEEIPKTADLSVAAMAFALMAATAGAVVIGKKKEF